LGVGLLIGYGIRESAAPLVQQKIEKVKWLKSTSGYSLVQSVHFWKLFQLWHISFLKVISNATRINLTHWMEQKDSQSGYM
jgi:hypothetical protein